MNLRKFHGKKFRADVMEGAVEGKICVCYHPVYGCDIIYLCQDEVGGDRPPNNDTLGYRYSWSNGRHSETLIETGKNRVDRVYNFKIINKKITYDTTR